MQDKLKLIVLGGATGSGKTQISIDLHRHLLKKGIATEIIAADSITHYKGFSIGAAKPNSEILDEIPHHLIDICDPEIEFTAGDFVRHATTAIDNILSRNSLPMLVGGSGFYIKALLQGMAVDNNEDKEKKNIIRKKLEEEAATNGIEPLYQRMLDLDPVLSQKIHLKDTYRIFRALEAMELHQKPWSELNKIAESRAPAYHPLVYFCLDLDRELQKEKINLRSAQMLKDGLLEEVKGLLANGVPKSTKPFQSIGYYQCLKYLGIISEEPKINSLEELEQAISLATWKLAKSQNTWFRSQAKQAIWIQAAYNPLEQILENLAQFPEIC